MFKLGLIGSNDVIEAFALARIELIGPRAANDRAAFGLGFYG